MERHKIRQHISITAELHFKSSLLQLIWDNSPSCRICCKTIHLLGNFPLYFIRKFSPSFPTKVPMFCFLHAQLTSALSLFEDLKNIARPLVLIFFCSWLFTLLFSTFPVHANSWIFLKELYAQKYRNVSTLFSGSLYEYRRDALWCIWPLDGSGMGSIWWLISRSGH